MSPEDSDTSPGSSIDPGLIGIDSPDNHPRKKRKVTRSKTACLPCRSRRSRCGALPPGPCPTCLSHGLACTWPTPGEGRGRGRPRTTRPSSEAVGGTEVSTERGAHPSHAQPPRHPLAGSTLEWPDPDQRLYAPAHQLQAGQPAPSTVDWGDTRYFSPEHTGIIQPPPRNERSYIVETQQEPFEETVAAPNAVYRYHGRTGTTPGRNSVMIGRTRPAASEAVFIHLDERTLPNPAITGHILDLFFKHFACRFPFLSRKEIDPESPHYPFLFHSIASLVARFSDRDEFSGSPNPPHAYGNVFRSQAKQHIGQMLGTATRETIGALLILAESASGDEVRTEMWMLVGMAVRLTLDSSLHISQEGLANVNERERRLNRLLFWSVLIADYSLSFAEGRPTSIRREEITQELPSEDDISGSETSNQDKPLRSPFPFTAEMILTFGIGIDIYNQQPVPQDSDDARASVVRQMRAKSAAQYDELPLDMMWNAANLQKHYRAGHGPMYLCLHLWNHTIQCSRYLHQPGKEVENISSFGPTGKTDRATLQSIQAGSWLHCARFVADMLVLADVIDPKLYLTTPSLAYCFSSAARCFIDDLEARLTDDASLHLAAMSAPNDASRQNDKSSALFRAIALDNIKILKHGLAKQVTFWHGLSHVLCKLEFSMPPLRRPPSVDRPESEQGNNGGPRALTTDSLDVRLAGFAEMNNTSAQLDLWASGNQALNSDWFQSSYQGAGPSTLAPMPSHIPVTDWSWLHALQPSPASADLFHLLGLDKDG